MYQSPLPAQERHRQGAWLRTQGFDNNNQRRELDIGFGSLRRVELVALCQHHGIDHSPDMTANVLAATLDAAWGSKKLGDVVEQALPVRPNLIQLRQRARVLGISIDGYDAEMADTMIKEAERAKASQSRAGLKAGNPEDDLGVPQALKREPTKGKTP